MTSDPKYVEPPTMEELLKRHVGRLKVVLDPCSFLSVGVPPWLRLVPWLAHYAQHMDAVDSAAARALGNDAWRFLMQAEEGEVDDRDVAELARRGVPEAIVTLFRRYAPRFTPLLVPSVDAMLAEAGR